VPFSPTAPTGLNVAFCVLGTVLAAALWWWRHRLPAVVAHAVVVLATGCVSGGVAASTTPAGTAVTSLGCEAWLADADADLYRRKHSRQAR
jgi:hypothetical protein